MRILRVAQKVYPDVPGGGAYHVHALSRDQAAMGHDVTVATVRHEKEAPREEFRAGYRVLRFDPSLELVGNEISANLAKFLATATNYDIIHAHSHLYFSTNLAAAKRSLSSVPLAITNHGLYSQNAPRWLFDIYLKTIGRHTFNAADVIFCYTEEDRNRVQEFGVSSDIRVVENGIDTDRFTPSGPQSDHISRDGPVVLFVGRLVEGKRPLDALNSFARIKDKHPNASIYFVGSGPLRDDLLTAIEDHGLQEQAHLIGQVEYDDMPRIYRAGDLLMLPSEAEGFPRTVLEAFSSGIPVITSSLPHLQEIVNEGGKTAPVGDIREFSDLIDQFLGDQKLRSDLGTHARSLVVKRFTWERTVEETTTALGEISDDLNK